MRKLLEISGYLSVDGYLKGLAIEKGMNPFQPTCGSLLNQSSTGH